MTSIVRLEFVLCVATIGCGNPIPDSPEAALKRFYEAEGVTEGQLMDPLILRPDVVPLLTKEVVKRDIRRRRYAILALGHIGDRRALDVLQQIAADPTEKGDYRHDALLAIALIDRALGAELASKYSDKDIAYLSRLKKELENDKPLERRTYAQALRGEHYP